MNTDDLSLIKLSGEDESILHPNDNVSIFPYNAYFACSPLLQISRSTTSFKPPSSPSPPLAGGSVEGNPADKSKDKENLNQDKSEVPQLGVERHQMKRKKRGGGGCNLRKSLAWHQAFFTDEGVLDPLELTMLSGNCGNGEMLSVIHEGRELISNGLESDGIPLASQAPKELPGSTPSKGRKIGSIQSSMPASAKGVGSASMTKRKILSAHDMNRSASKHSSLPRQVASSSLKWPPSGNKQKADAKESKVSRLLTPKSDPPVVSTTSQRGIDISSNFKRNPKVGSRKIIGVKRSSIDATSAQNDVKSRTPGKSKSTIQQVQRNEVKSVRITHSSTALRSQVRPANNSFVPDPPTAHPPNEHGGSTTKLTTLSQHSSNNGKSMQCAQSQVAQPSGLRKPSPSLRFFDQPKPFDVHRSTQIHNPSESTIPRVHKHVTSNSVHQRPPQSYVKQYRGGQGIGRHAADIGNTDFGKIKLNKELNRKLEVDVRISAEVTEDMSGHVTKFHSICNDVGITNSGQSTSEMQEDQQSIMSEVKKQSMEEAELMKPVSDVESQIFGIKTATLFEGGISSVKFDSCNALQAADPSLNAPHCTASHCKDARRTKDEVDGDSKLCLGFDKGRLQLLSVDGSLSANGCESILSTNILDNSQSVIIDDPSTKLVEVVELPVPSLLKEQTCSDNHELHSNGYLLQGKSFSCEEPKEKNALQSVKAVGSKDHDTCDNESSSLFLSVTSPVRQGCDPNASVDPEAEFKNDIDHNDNACPLEIKRERKSHVVDTGSNCNIDEANFSGDGGRASEDSYITPQLAATQVKVASVKNCKKDSLAIEPPPNAVPFSDEWLAAIEAAGEEILTRKGGAVQNSPTDKSLPEPGPWSPVKKKNNKGLGPFDCTKFTNTD